MEIAKIKFYTFPYCIETLELFLNDHVTQQTGVMADKKISFAITGIHLIMKYIKISAVKRLIAMNRVQNKSICLHNICVCTVYIYYVFVNRHTCMYIFKKNILFIY